MEFRFLFTDNRQLKIKQIFLLTFFILYGIRNADIEIMIYGLKKALNRYSLEVLHCRKAF